MAKGVSSPGATALHSALLLLLLLCVTASLSREDTAKYVTFEEEAPGSVMAVLSEDLLFNSADRPASSFRLMNGGVNSSSPLLRLRESDGQLSIGDRIDREQICRQSPHCTLALDVLSFSKEQFRLVHVEVEVRDINDNAPRFPNAQIPVEVSESATVGTRVPLDIATDEDVGTNSIQSYQISANSHFSIEVQTRADGVKYADLVLVKELDRESQDSFTLELVARDGGTPALSGSAALTVRVLDFNDHWPVFEQSLLSVDLIEDAPVGSLLLELHAADPDEGVNGQVVYSFSPQVSPEVRELFRMDSRTGRLTLQGAVDFETKQTYEFDVQAQDLGPSPLAATCKIIVHITDVNDNAPAITVTPLTSISAGVAHISEAASRESFVALISTLDSDSGPNGQVYCSLYGHEHFKLQQAYEDSYMIVTTAALDREKISEYNLTIVAEDLGSPPFKTMRPFTIRVSDENDNAPSFAKAVYEVSVLENNAPGAYITTVVARDPDLGRNGKVTYSLVDREVLLGAPLFSVITVDPGSGALYAVRPFDFESLKELELEIEATDEGLPQLSGRTLLRVKIVDQNDNPPIITSPRLRNGSADLLLPLRAPPRYLLVQLRAEDADQGMNSALQFAIVQDTLNIFTINRITGELSLRRRLDVESAADSSVSLVVSVSDKGSPSLSSTATLHVILTNTAPSSDQLVVMQSTTEEQTELDDFSIVLIAVLSGSCLVLLIAIILVAVTCRRRPGHMKHGLTEPERNKEGKLLESVSSSETGSCSGPETLSDSCQLSISTESDSCGDLSRREASREPENFDSTQEDSQSAGAQGGVSARFHPASAGQEDKSVTCLSSSQAHPDKFSGKDSGRGDRDFHESDSDLNSDGSKINCQQTVEKQSAYGERRMYNNTGTICKYPPQRLQQSLRMPSSQHGSGYMMKYSCAPVSPHRAQLPQPTYHPQHPNLKAQWAKSVQVHGAWENTGPQYAVLCTLPRRYNELPHFQQTRESTSTSELATTF